MRCMHGILKKYFMQFLLMRFERCFESSFEKNDVLKMMFEKNFLFERNIREEKNTFFLSMINIQSSFKMKLYKVDSETLQITKKT